MILDVRSLDVTVASVAALRRFASLRALLWCRRRRRRSAASSELVCCASLSVCSSGL